MGTRALISGLFLVIISIVTCIMAYRLGLGTGGDQGAGFAAFGIASLLGLMSLYLLIKSLVQCPRGAGGAGDTACCAGTEPVTSARPPGR